MRNIIYRQEIHKKPFGASRDDEEIIIDILIKNDLYQKYINLVYFKDGEFENKTILPMKYTSSKNSYNRYSVKISPLEIGLYFYYFELGIEDRIFNVSKINFCAEISDELHPW